VVSQKDNLLKESRLYWYQSIDKKHLWAYVKFDGGLSIPFASKLRFEKVGLFPRDGLPFFKSLKKAGFVAFLFF
jgi:hypothetical protein